MFRSFFKKVLLCLGIIAAAVLLKYQFPAVSEQIGQWLSGTGSRVSNAISCFVEKLRDGDAIANAVEVFHDAFGIH